MRLPCAGTSAAPWGLLPSASQWVPTPHLDRLLGKASAWWRGTFPAAAPAAQGSAPGKAAPKPAADKPPAAAQMAHKGPGSAVPAPEEAPAARPKQAPPQPEQQAPKAAPEPAQTSDLPQQPRSAAERLNAVKGQLSQQAAQARAAAARTGAWASGKADDAVAALSGAARAAPDHARSAWQRTRLLGAHALSKATALVQRAGARKSAAVAAIAALTTVLLGSLALLMWRPSMASQLEEAAAPAIEPQGQLACTPATAGHQTAARCARIQYFLGHVLLGQAYFLLRWDMLFQVAELEWCPAMVQATPQARKRGGGAAGAARRGGALQPTPCAAHADACQQHAAVPSARKGRAHASDCARCCSRYRGAGLHS